jgi:hypothetical protein
MTFDLDQAIKEQVVAAYKMYADLAVDEDARRELLARADALRGDDD